MPGVIVKRSLHDDEYWYKIAVVGGLLAVSYRRADLEIELNISPVQIGLPDIVHTYETETLKEISLRTAMANVSVGGGQGHFCCKCTLACNKGTCKCFKAGLKCGSRCHKNNQMCTNKCIEVVMQGDNEEVFNVQEDANNEEVQDVMEANERNVGMNLREEEEETELITQVEENESTNKRKRPENNPQKRKRVPKLK